MDYFQKNILKILKNQHLGISEKLFHNNLYSWGNPWDELIEEFINKPILLEERDIILNKILMNSKASADLLTKIDIEFLKNKRIYIISFIERYKLITSICMETQAAMQYFYNGYPFKEEQKKLVETFIINDYCLDNILRTKLKSIIGKLTDYEKDLIINKIIKNHDIPRACKLYQNKTFKLNEKQKEKLSSLLIIAKLSEKF